MARRRRADGVSLQRVLGAPALFSTAYGNVGSSIYYALGVVAASALGVTPVVFILTGLLFATTAWSYAEAASLFPEAGGSSSFARHAFNEFWSFGAGWALMLDYIVTIAISAFFVPNYLSIFWPVLKTWPYNSIGGVAVVIALVAINVFGIKEAARINITLAVLDLATQVLVMVIGVILLLQPALLINQIHLGTAPTWTQLIYGISIGCVAYTGIETVSNMAEEASNPGRDVPRAINAVLVAVLVVYAGISMTALSALPVEANVLAVDPATHLTIPVEVIPADPAEVNGPFVLRQDPTQDVYVRTELADSGKRFIPALQPTGEVTQLPDGTWVTSIYGTVLGNVYLEDPIQGIVQRIPDSLGWVRAILGPWVGFLAATILIIATNAGIIGASRLTYSMGQHRQLPAFMGRLHPRRLTPYVSIILFGSIACLLIVPGKTGLLADLYAFGAMISFTVAHISVIALRIQQPDAQRPFKTPVNIMVRGRLIPVLAVVGGIGTFAVWCVVVATHPLGRIVGFTWMGVGLIMYVVYRKAHGYSLTRTVRRVPLPEAGAQDIVYQKLLVPLVDSQVADEMMVLACQLATEKKAAIDALYVIEVPLNLPLDARLPKNEDRAQAVLEGAVAIADQFKIPVTPVVVRARQAGRAIVETAAARHSEVIVLGSRRKRRIGGRLFGDTTSYVLEHASTEVVHTIVPEEGLTPPEPVATGYGNGSSRGARQGSIPGGGGAH